MDSGNRNDALAEKLDRRRIAGCQYAAGKLQRYPTPPYSPEIARLRNIESLLKLAMFQIRNPSDNYSEAMDKLQLKLGSIDITIPPTIQEIRQLRSANMQVLKAMEIQEHKTGSARSRYQDSLIEMYEKAGKTLSATAVRRIKRAEATARVWVDVSAARGLNKGGGLSHVLIPEDPAEDPATCQEWTKVDDPQEIRSKVAQRLHQHLSQSKD